MQPFLYDVVFWRFLGAFRLQFVWVINGRAHREITRKISSGSIGERQREEHNHFDWFLWASLFNAVIFALSSYITKSSSLPAKFKSQSAVLSLSHFLTLWSPWNVFQYSFRGLLLSFSPILPSESEKTPSTKIETRTCRLCINALAVCYKKKKEKSRWTLHMIKMSFVCVAVCVFHAWDQ